jgi:hypothetical protein
MKPLRFPFVALATALVLAACGGGDDPMGPGAGGPFTATIAGQPWQSDQISLTTVSAGAVTPGSLVISGTQVGTGGSYRSLILILGFLTGPGTYPLGVNVGTTGGGSGTVAVWDGSTSTQYLTPFSGNAGTVQITSLTGSQVVGTFSFTAPPTLGGGASQTVTNGAFDVPLPSNFVAATQAGRGSTMTATLGTTAWNGATVLTLGTAGGYVVSATTDSHIISIAPLVPIVAGTPYSLPNQVQILVSQAGTTNSWGGPGSTGTITYTTIGARLIGSFSGTLAPGGATVGSLSVAAGTFDIKAP